MGNLSAKQWAVVALTAATALIHLVALGIALGDVLFILNGVGYFALVVGLYFVPDLASQRSLIRWAFIGYTALTIVLYFFINPDPFGSVLGLITKAIELILIILLWLDRGGGAIQNE